MEWRERIPFENQRCCTARTLDMPRAHRATPAEIEMRARTRAASRRSVESTTRRECSRNWELRWQKVGHMHLLKWAPMGKVSVR